MNNDNLKPVIFDAVRDSAGNQSRNNVYVQNLLLKALSSGVTDIDELKKIAGVRTAAEVFNTLDKMQIRKEYHVALQAAGMDLPFLVEKLKGLLSDETSDKIKLGAVQTLLKSIGLDKYEKDENAGKNWEEFILETISKKEQGQITEGELVDEADYEVNSPVLPEEVKIRQAEEKKASEGLYN
jgi:hypothetical protein